LCLTPLSHFRLTGAGRRGSFQLINGPHSIGCDGPAPPTCGIFFQNFPAPSGCFSQLSTALPLLQQVQQYFISRRGKLEQPLGHPLWRNGHARPQPLLYHLDVGAGDEPRCLKELLAAIPFLAEKEVN
ncbi:hypothetical protein, partial [Parvibacter caecicola]|uniref:hypothetical protein n=1 Tax=Parvibacter caecicola TaxID=747645 RepID=UPI003F733FAF